MKPKITFLLLSCSKDQLIFFNHLNAYLQRQGHTSSLVQAKNLPLLSRLTGLFNKTSQITALVEAVNLYIRRKKSVSLNKRSKLYWRVCRFKQRLIAKAYLSAFKQTLRNYQSDYQGNYLVIWNGKKFVQSIALIAANELAMKVIYAELGPLPGMLQFSTQGVNASAALPQYGDYYLPFQEQSSPQKQRLVKPVWTSTKKNESAFFRILVPFQVVEDSNLYVHSPWIRNMHELFQLCTKLLDTHHNLEISIKTHPKCPIDYSCLKARHSRMHFIPNDRNINELLAECNAVMTINSTIGLEAIRFGIPVISLGEAIYNVSGICLSASNWEELDKAVERLQYGWRPSLKIAEGFLSYIENHYAIKAHMLNPTEEQLHSIYKKLLSLTHQDI